VEELLLTDECCAVGRSIRDMAVRKQTGSTILAVRHGATGSFDTNPSPDAILESGDTIIAIGTPAEIARLEGLVGQCGCRASRGLRPVLGIWSRKSSRSGLPSGHGGSTGVSARAPADEAYGDYASPVCLQIARDVGERPRALAEQLRSGCWQTPRWRVWWMPSRWPVRGSSTSGWGAAYAAMMRALVARGESVGAAEPRSKPRINLEFVSVNPNGPLHAGHGRYAAYGDSLKRLLSSVVRVWPRSSTSTTTVGRWTASAAVSPARYAQSFGWRYRFQRMDIRATMWPR